MALQNPSTLNTEQESTEERNALLQARHCKTPVPKALMQGSVREKRSALLQAQHCRSP